MSSPGQNLVRRSHKAGGLTLEGRYALRGLFDRLRRTGYRRGLDINTQNPDAAPEQIVTHLGGASLRRQLVRMATLGNRPKKSCRDKAANAPAAQLRPKDTDFPPAGEALVQQQTLSLPARRPAEMAPVKVGSVQSGGNRPGTSAKPP